MSLCGPLHIETTEDASHHEESAHKNHYWSGIVL